MLGFGPVGAGGAILLFLGLVFLLLFVILFFWLFAKSLKFAFKAVINAIVGLVCIFLLGLFGVSIPLSLPVIIIVALFGLAGLGAILILMFFGVKI